MEIVDLVPADPRGERCAELLVEAFREIAPDAWPTLDKARETVEECLKEGPVRIALIDGAVAGWIGARVAYMRVWELHPLVIDPAFQRRGIGRALVADLERIVAERGAMTLVLGTDDETGLTSLAGVDLYPDPLAHLARLRNLGGHSFEFYLKCGFAISGVAPDANGFGQPDLQMAKRVGPAPAPKATTETFEGFVATGAGRTSLRLELSAERAVLHYVSRWMGQPQLELSLEFRRTETQSHAGGLVLESAHGIPLPPSDGPIVLEYARVPSQHAELAGSETMEAAGHWTDPWSLLLWVHRDSIWDDGTDLPPEQYDPPREAFAPVVRVLAELVSPWKLG